MNKLFYGDNLNVLREHIASESVDLIYLDSKKFGNPFLDVASVEWTERKDEPAKRQGNLL